MKHWCGIMSGAMMVLAAVGNLAGVDNVSETLLAAVVFALWEIAAKRKDVKQ